MRRQTWLQRNQAVQVVNTYAEAMSASKGRTQQASNMPDAPRRKGPIQSMADFIDSQGLQ
jgi:hypothetical protein